MIPTMTPDSRASSKPDRGNPLSHSNRPIRFRRTSGNAFVAPTAILTGEVLIGEACSFWFGAVVRGDVAPVRLGKRVNVQDNAIIHCDSGVENVIEDDVTIGHGAIVHGAFVGAGSLIDRKSVV